MRTSCSSFGLGVLATALLSNAAYHGVLGFHLTAPLSSRPTANQYVVSLSVAAMTEPTEAVKLASKVKGQKNNSKKTPATSANRPKSRKARNKKFLMKKWKAQQAAQKIREEQLQSKEYGRSELVNAIGVDLAEIRQSRKGNRNSQAPKMKTNNKTKKSPAKGSLSPTKKRKASTSRANIKPWSLLMPGSTVSGKVIKLLPYGALVQIPYDIPGKTRGCVLLHESQMLQDKKQKLKVGQRIENARVLALNRDKGTVSVSLRPVAQRATSASNLQVGDEVQGKVVRLQKYGAFVDIGLKRNALLHLSRMSMYKVTNITDHVQVGQSVQVRILKLEGGDIAVSMLSKDNDAFVDRRDLQRKRLAIWETVVNAHEEEEAAEAKRQLLEVDRQIWDQFMANSEGPKSGEV